jgi:hypothetical protein
VTAEVYAIISKSTGYSSSMVDIHARISAPFTGHAENPIVAFMDKPVSRGADRHRGAVKGYWDRAGKETQAGIDHVCGAVNRDREKHVLPHGLMTWRK